MIGYAAAAPWQKLSAYRFSVEVSAYTAPSVKSQGWESKLFEILLAELKNNSVHAVIGGISLPNPSSVALHEKFGMQKVAHYKEVGSNFDRWVDVGYWQLILGNEG
jgi:L-amino acid N-acyltransferase YncA